MAACSLCMYAGADPGFRRGGGVHTGISGADPNCCRALGKSTSKRKLQTAVGGVSDHPQKNPLYPRMVCACMHACMHVGR